MEITIPASRQVFETAILAARRATPPVEFDGLASIIGANLIGRVEEVWDSIEAALRHAFQYGREEAVHLMNVAVQKTETLLIEAGQKAREIQETILQRLHSFTQALFEGMLSRVPTSIRIGTDDYVLKTLNLSQKLVATGSLKTNLTEVLNLAASGEIEVGAEYSVGGAQGASV
jgi:hypothetical protein